MPKLPQLIICSVRTTHTAHHNLNCFPSLTINCQSHCILATSRHKYLNLCNICCRHGELFKVYCGQDHFVATAINTENTNKERTVFFLLLHRIVHFCIDLYNLYAIYSPITFRSIYHNLFNMEFKTRILRDEIVRQFVGCEMK